MAKKKKLKKTKKAGKQAKKVVRKAKKGKKARRQKGKKAKGQKGKKKAAKGKKGRKAAGKKGKKIRASRRPTGLRKPAKKPMTVQKKQAISNASAAVMQRLIGKVVHYYDRIGVAIIDLKEPLRVGDMVMLKKGDRIVPQRIESMEIEHASVPSAKPGDIVGVKVDTEAYEGTVVLPG